VPRGVEGALRALRARASPPCVPALPTPAHASDHLHDAVHVFINPALEARFEAARTVLTALGRRRDRDGLRVRGQY
jgi:hypothetical protein